MGTIHEKIIVVDDDITNLAVAQSAVDEKYSVFTAPSGEKLFKILEKVTPDLILLDVDMPEMNGYDVIKKLKSEVKTAGIPVIFLTAQIDPESEIKGLDLGAVDYISKPFSRALLIKRIELHLLLEKQKRELMRHNRDLEYEVAKKSKAVLELQNAVIKTMAELVERRDSITGGHIERTQHYLARLISLLLEHGIYTEELSKWDINLFIMSSQLHDVGKISIKDDILKKPGELTREEFEEIKKHCDLGVDIISSIEEGTTQTEFLECAKIFAGTHHEKWNGNGYPEGLSGDAIPLQGRLMAIVDVYDALTNERPYKKAYTHEKSVEIIRSGKGTDFDPLVAEIFLMHENEFNQAVKNYFKPDTGYNRPQPAGRIYGAIKIVVSIINAHGGNGSGHIEKIKRYLELLVNALLEHEDYRQEVSGWDIGLFLASAQLYDAGEITVSDEILNKSGALTKDEFDNIKAHADFGVEIVRKMKEVIEDEALLCHAEALAGSHHERWDGAGYPLGLKGKDIPLQGRIMAIVDVYDALTSNRPHREKMTHREAVATIGYGRGTQFDPGLVDVFLKCEAAFERAGTQ